MSKKKPKVLSDDDLIKNVEIIKIDSDGIISTLKKYGQELFILHDGKAIFLCGTPYYIKLGALDKFMIFEYPHNFNCLTDCLVTLVKKNNYLITAKKILENESYPKPLKMAIALDPTIFL